MESLPSSCRLCGHSKNVKINLFSYANGTETYAQQIEEVFKVKVKQFVSNVRNFYSNYFHFLYIF